MAFHTNKHTRYVALLVLVLVLCISFLSGAGNPVPIAKAASRVTNNNTCLTPPTTTLAFRTLVGGVSIPVGTSQMLGTVPVSCYTEIRLVADERVGSPSNVGLRLTITEGSELVAQLATPLLVPHAQYTDVYAVPGTTLTVYADAAEVKGAGKDSIDVLIYGH